MNFDDLANVKNIEITSTESTQIEIKLLKTNPYQPRLKDNDIETLAKSIQQHGQLQPIVINQDNVIIGGHRRYYAHIHLNKESIKCTRVHTSDTELYTLAIVENEERENLTDIERGLSYRIALDNKIFETAKDLAAGLNKSPSHVTKMLNLLKLPKVIQDDIRDNKRKPSVDTLNCLMSINNDEKMIEIYFKYIRGEINRSQIKEIVKKQKVIVDKAIIKVARNKLKVEYDLKGISKEDQKELEIEVQSILDKFLFSKSPGAMATTINLVVASALLKYIV